MYSLSVSSFIVLVRYSILINVTLSRMSRRPHPASFVGRWTFFCLESFAFSYNMICVESLLHMFLWLLKPVVLSLSMPPVSVVWVPIVVSMEVHSLKMQFIIAIGR